MNIQGQKDCVIIGYFGVRAKAQICRLLCEYLQISYKDRFFTPEQWDNFQKNQAKNWIIKGLPFLIDKDFVITGQHAINEYIIRKSNKLFMLGNSIKDRIKIDMFKSKHDIKDNIIGLICQMNRNNSKQSKIPQQSPQFYWKQMIEPKLQEYQKSCKADDWYFGYLTIADFTIYQMMNNILWLFPNITNLFPKLVALRNKVYCLDKINQYENSDRTVKIFNPLLVYYDFQRSLLQKKKDG